MEIHIHPYHGEVEIVKRVTELSAIVKLASGAQTTVTTALLKLKTPPPAPVVPQADKPAAP